MAEGWCRASGQTLPLFAPLFPRAKGARESVCVCARTDEVDLHGLHISIGESSSTDLPLGALGHWPLSLLPPPPPGGAPAPLPC